MVAISDISVRSVLLATVATAVSVSLLALSGVVWRADNWFYDLLLSHRKARVDDRIVVIAIDDKSLSTLGRWPWSRRVHADLLQRLQRAQPRGIAIDVAFSEPDRGAASDDLVLAAAIERSGNVVLPVMVERSEPGGTPIEVLPLPVMTAGAAALGHVAVDTDADGVTRSAYLRAGLGDARWPMLAAALHRFAATDDRIAGLPGLRNPNPRPISPYLWKRDNHVLVPFVPTELFAQASYIDVLRGQVPDALLRDRWVLVGATSSGLGDSILTPLQGAADARMPGVLYQANLLNMLLLDDAIVPLATAWQLPLSILLVLVPVLLLLRYRSRRAWLIVPIALLVVTLSSAVLLDYGHRWFPPMACIVGLLIAFVLLALRQLYSSHRLAHSDALTGLANRRLFDVMLTRELGDSRRNGSPLSLFLIDVDHFKHYNDRYGHQAGDGTLRKVAQVVARHIGRPRDLAVRYGGDELAAILPETRGRDAHAIAEAIVRDVAAMAIPHAGSDVAEHVTVSIGIATNHSRHGVDSAMLLERADTALYQAKKQGRNTSYREPDTDTRTHGHRPPPSCDIERR